MKNSGIEWIGEIPDSWNVVQLASLFIEHKQKNTGMQSNNLLSLSYGKIKRKDINTSDGLLPESFENYNVVDSGDIVLRLTDLQNDQRSLRTGLCLEKGIVTSAYVTLRKRNANLNSEFMHYYLHSFDVRKGFYGMGSGVRQGLNFDGIKKLAVLLPPQKIQEAIVEYLSKKLGEVDKLIEVQQAQIDKLKEYKQSVITEAVTKGLDPTVPMKDSGVEWIGKVAVENNIEKLKFLLIAPMQYGANESGINDSAEGIRYIRITDIADDNTLKNSEDNMYLPRLLAESYLLHDQDVLFARSGGTVGKTFIYDKKYGQSAFAGYLIKAECNKEKLLPYFLAYYTQSSIYNLWKNSIFIQATIQNIGATKYSNMEVVIPPIENQKQIIDYLDDKCAKIDKLIAIKQAKIDKLQEYKKSLIYEYVTGKKEVM